MVLLSSILGPNIFLQLENVRDPKQYPLFQIVTMETLKYFAQGAYIPVQAMTVNIFKMGIRNGVANCFSDELTLSWHSSTLTTGYKASSSSKSWSLAPCLVLIHTHRLVEVNKTLQGWREPHNFFSKIGAWNHLEA